MVSVAQRHSIWILPINNFIFNNKVILSVVSLKTVLLDIGSPVEPLGRSEKRKHDEDTEESDSEGDSMNLASALDNYDSELDSDYVSGEF